MTAYEKELLALAYEECDKRHLRLTLYPYPFGLFADVARLPPDSHEYETIGGVDAATDEEGLRSLLTGLGVEVPERPSAGLVSALETALFDLMENIPADEVLTFLRRRFGEDPALVLALLEGGES